MHRNTFVFATAALAFVLGTTNDAKAEKIVSAKVIIQVYDDDKECGEAVVKVKVGDKSYEWGYGKGEDWEDDDDATYKFTKKDAPLPIELDGPLKVYGNLEERPGEVNIDAGLNWTVILVTDEGNILTYGGRHYYRTGDGDTSIELTKED